MLSCKVFFAKFSFATVQVKIMFLITLLQLCSRFDILIVEFRNLFQFYICE